MKQFDLIPHTADIRLVIQGTTREELFTAALEGMASIIMHACKPENTNAQDIKLKTTYETSAVISTTSIDITALLIDFLSDVLTQTHLQKTVFTHLIFHELSDTHIHATIYGNKVTHFDEDIKAVTYHEANVIKNSIGNYQTTIVFDI